MLATKHTSAGVYSAENDRSERIAAIGTSIGAIVGASHRGPVMQISTVFDKEGFRSRYGKKNPRVSYMHHCAEAFLKESSRLQVVRVAIDSKYGGAFISTRQNFAVSRSLASGIDDVSQAPMMQNDILFFYGKDQGTWNNDIEIVYYPDTSDPDGHSFIIEVYEGDSGIPAERHVCRTYNYTDGHGRQLFVEDVIGRNSNLLNVVFNDQHPAYLNQPKSLLVNAVGNVRLAGGDNGKDINVGDPASLSALMQAWTMFNDWEKVDCNILINGGYVDPAIHIVLDQVAKNRQDCIAVFDFPIDGQKAVDAVDYRQNRLNLNTSWSAAYIPDLLVRDDDNGRNLYVPPSGHVAARYAYTDRTGTWLAPGGLDRGRLNGVLGVRESYKQGELNMLAENQINPIKNISGNGVNIFGADTLYAVKSALNDIGIRRLLGMLHGSVRVNNLFAVFQPNDTYLRTQQRTSLENILEPIRRAGGLYWFDVVCDSRNNTPQTEANGDLIIDVYLDPIRYTKRIHLNAVVPKTGKVQAAVELLNRI